MAARKKTPPLTPEQAAAKTYNSAYEAFVRLAAMAGRVDGDVLAIGHAVAKTTVRAQMAHGALACTRCDGSGYTTFAWIEEGRCFACNRAGSKPKPETKEAAAAA